MRPAATSVAFRPASTSCSRALTTTYPDKRRKTMFIRSRRNFLRVGLQSVGALGALGRFGSMNALAATSGNYKALVCVFLFGGNDSHNTVVPITTQKQNYTQYSGARQGMGIAQNSL